MESAISKESKPLLAAASVQKYYRNPAVSVHALIDLDLQVHAGEMVAVMGPSGSGKTTLLNCLSGLDDIDAGQVLVGGRDLFAMHDWERTEHRARTMGFVFQSFNPIPVFTAVENVELPLLLIGHRARQARERAREMLAAVGLRHRADHLPNQMSGGEQQRVTIGDDADQGYLAMGLLVAITGLGVVMTRSVRERRRTIGVLRALGVQSRTVRRAFLAESAFIAMEGVAVGTLLGVLTTWLLYRNSPAFGSLDVAFPIAWLEISFTVGLALVASFLATVVPARRAAAVRPALAVRVAE